MIYNILSTLTIMISNIFVGIVHSLCRPMRLMGLMCKGRGFLLSYPVSTGTKPVLLYSGNDEWKVYYRIDRIISFSLKREFAPFDAYYIELPLGSFRNQ